MSDDTCTRLPSVVTPAALCFVLCPPPVDRPIGVRTATARRQQLGADPCRLSITGAAAARPDVIKERGAVGTVIQVIWL